MGAENKALWQVDNIKTILKKHIVVLTQTPEILPDLENFLKTMVCGMVKT